MSLFGALAATVPVLGSLFDPDQAQQNKLEAEEKQYLQLAQKAEAAGDTAAAIRHRAQARITHNQRIRLAQDVVRQKAADCRKHGWTQAAEGHDQTAQRLEYEIWADTDSAAHNTTGSSSSSQQPKTAAPVPTNTAHTNATATPPPISFSSSTASSSQQGAFHIDPVADGTSWPPQSAVASTASSSTDSLPPPPSYDEAVHDSDRKST